MMSRKLFGILQQVHVCLVILACRCALIVDTLTHSAPLSLSICVLCMCVTQDLLFCLYLIGMDFISKMEGDSRLAYEHIWLKISIRIPSNLKSQNEKMSSLQHASSPARDVQNAISFLCFSLPKQKEVTQFLLEILSPVCAMPLLTSSPSIHPVCLDHLLPDSKTVLSFYPNAQEYWTSC